MKVASTIYYAHSMSLYNKPQEKRDIETLEQLGFAVVNPNSSVYQLVCATIVLENETKDEASKKIMQYFKDEVVSKCDALAFRAFPDGKIGQGVWAEIQWAIKLGMPVIELPSILSIRELGVNDTREYLKLTGER